MSENEKKAVSEEENEAVETPKTQKVKKKIDKEMIKKMTTLALLSAIIVVLQAFAPSLRIGVVEFTLVLIPITIGAIIQGPVGGAILGGVFGIMAVVGGFTGASAFTAGLLGISPVLTILLCLVKGAAAGFFAGVIYKLFRKKSVVAATFAAAAIAPIANTGIFVAGSLTILANTISKAFELGPEQTVASFLLGSIFFINFLIEFGVNMLFATAIKTIVDAVQKATSKK